MKSIQYTIRSIPEPVDKALRAHAKKTGQSFNATVVDALKKATNTQEGTKKVYTDLDWFIGLGIQDSQSFDEAIEWLDSLPHDLNENFN